MKRKEDLLQRQQQLLNCLSGLPRRMLLLYDQDNVAEFVLHELCQEYCFNLEKAAYFIDNPDFNCLKGVAGFYRKEAYPGDDIWQDPKAFSIHMESTPFNRKVKEITKESFKKKGEPEEKILKNVSHSLEIKQPGLYIWNIKYDNQGYFIYEKESESSCPNEYLLNGICLLSFCPFC